MKVVLLSFLLAVVIAAASVDGFQDQTRVLGTIGYGDK